MKETIDEKAERMLRDMLSSPDKWFSLKKDMSQDKSKKEKNREREYLINCIRNSFNLMNIPYEVDGHRRIRMLSQKPRLVSWDIAKQPSSKHEPYQVINPVYAL